MPQNPASPASAPVSPQNIEPDPLRWKILTVIIVIMFVTLTNVSTVNVLLPTLESSLNASTSSLQWLLSGYALSFGIVLVAAGRVGDMVGRAGVFIVGVLLFAVSALGCGLAPDVTTLNISRVLMGVAAGVTNPQVLGLMQQYFRGKERGKAFGYFGMAIGISFALGPVLSGLSIWLFGPILGWRCIFLVNAPICLVGIWLCYKWFPKPFFAAPRDKETGKPVSLLTFFNMLDPIGIIMLAIAVVMILLPFVEYRSVSNWVWALLPLSLIMFYLWYRWERYRTNTNRTPMMDLHLLQTSSYSHGIAIMGMYFMGNTSIWVIVALYFQEGAGHGALATGILGLPSALGGAYMANWSGQRVARMGRKLVIYGLCVAMICLLLTAGVLMLHEKGILSEWWAIVTLFVMGLGQGCVVSPNQALSLSDVPVEEGGVAGAVMQTCQRLGASTGMAVITSIVFSISAAASWGAATAMGLVVVTLVFGLALMVGIKDQRVRRRNW